MTIWWSISWICWSSSDICLNANELENHLGRAKVTSITLVHWWTTTHLPRWLNEHFSLIFHTFNECQCSSHFVLVPPRIISHSPKHMHLTVREGRDARFSCMAFGRPVPVIVWHVNGLSRPALVSNSMLFVFDLERRQNFSSLTSRHSFFAATHNGSILHLRNISRLDAGRVDCSASNTLSTVNRQFLLHVECEFLDRSRQHTSWTRIFFNFR